MPSAPAAVRMLVDIFASQQQPVKIEPEMNGKDLLEREAVPSGPGNGSELSAITSFLLKSQQDDRKGRLAADVPDWKVMNSVECENTFPFVREQESCCNVHEGPCTVATRPAAAFHSFRRHKWGFHYRASFLFMWPCIRRGITRTHKPSVLPSWWQHFPAFDSQNCFRGGVIAAATLLAIAKKGKMVRNEEKLQRLLEINPSGWCKGWITATRKNPAELSL